MANTRNAKQVAEQRHRGSRTAQPADNPPGLPPHVQPSRAARRPEMIRQRREERRQTYERERRGWLLTRIGIGVVAALLVAGIGYVVFTSIQRGRVPEGTQEFAVGAGHTVETVAYDPVPPVGGEHDATPQTCGFYAAPVRNENAVHSLEHGAIWITYRPDLPSEQVDRLRALVEKEAKVLVSPFDDLPAPVVASSWGRQLQLDSAQDDRLGQFVQRFRGDAPEPFASCIGVGTPL
jgi:hypothetical protein